MTVVAVSRGGLVSIDRRAWTVYCAMPDAPRGWYSEEIDVVETGESHRRPSLADVRRAAQAELDAYYDPGLAIRRIRRCW